MSVFRVDINDAESNHKFAYVSGESQADARNRFQKYYAKIGDKILTIKNVW